ncbi:MAG: SGNH/GDSL hydrolase family protein [Armatimonadetes bacterium]|nr:SGNH/GDSL hydrolase family protein [Armatimonadota bacterium]
MRRFLIPIAALVCLVTVEAQDVRLVLPPDLYAAPGREMNLYFDNAILVLNSREYLFDVDCPKGRQDQERWRFTPTEQDVGDYPLSLKVMDAAGAVLAEGAATVRVAPAGGSGKPFTLLCVGDSLTHASVYPAELFNLFGPERIKLIGTHHPIDSLPPEVVHEGYGGWAWQTFCTRWTEGDDPRAKSPFLRLEGDKPVLDFQAYCDRTNGGQGPDITTVFLGWNDIFSATEADLEGRIDTVFGYADTLLAEFRRVRADTQIGLLLLTPPAATQDAFGSNYNCGQTRWQARRNQHRLVERMMEKFGGRESENLWLLPAHLNLDTVNNYPVVTEPANARTDKQVTRLANGVHPSAEGYRQIADTIYAWLSYRLSR